ncbi:acyl-CoA thioesterase-1 [Humitalea rosea]|uniref:Acyl-CoA thioesterase-1 n=1 Tax=Humitalea rosea TaxID=990373 RepID=A0A2W7ISZ2_9PROT|nr:acyl-CoA thioesterase-1 [Humitalea rosea]
MKALAGFAVFPGLAAAAVAPNGGAREIAIAMLGDSITAGYGLARADGPTAQLESLLRAAGNPVRVVDAGVSGDTSAGGRSRLDWMLADKPDAVILALGGNDGLRGLPPGQTYVNLADILDRLAARGLPVMMAGMLAPPNLGADYGREFAAIFTRLAAEHPAVIFYPFLLEGIAGDPALNQADRIHPNPRGAALLARNMLAPVERLLALIPDA